MRQFFIQFFKDWAQMVFRPVFFLIAGFCCSMWSFKFPRELIDFSRIAGVSPLSQAGMGGGYNIYETVFISHLSFTHFILLFIVPVFTMRLIAEEKKLGTFNLLLTAPISSLKIVLAKFMSAYLAVLMLVGISFIYPFMVSGLTTAEFNMSLLVSAYVSVVLLMGVYTSIGLFSSSLTSSLILSVVLGIIFSASLHFVVGLMGQFSDHPIYSAVTDYLSISAHLNGFFRGHIETHSVVFFFIVIGFFLFLTQRVVESIRWRS